MRTLHSHYNEHSPQSANPNTGKHKRDPEIRIISQDQEINVVSSHKRVLMTGPKREIEQPEKPMKSEIVIEDGDDYKYSILKGSSNQINLDLLPSNKLSSSFKSPSPSRPATSNNTT